MSDWESVKQAQNLVRHSKSGTYYLRAKVLGKIIRRSLSTKSLKIAKQKRDHLLPILRKSAELNKSKSNATTLTEALTIASERHIEKPGIKASTIKYWKQIHESLIETLPLKTPLTSLNTEHLRSWWKRYTTIYSPQRANNALAMLKTLTSILLDQGSQTTDIAAPLKRVPLPTTKIDILNREQLHEIINDIRRQKTRISTESANMIHFLAYSGLRISEMNRVEWKHIKDDTITVYTSKARGNKNPIRILPINPPLQEIITQMRTPTSSGTVFHIQSPKYTLTSSCKRLNIPHTRVHDLRHFFATLCIEQGIDIPTIAAWLGHSDGGTLVMKTYGHLHQKHSLAQAKKIQ